MPSREKKWTIPKRNSSATLWSCSQVRKKMVEEVDTWVSAASAVMWILLVCRDEVRAEPKGGARVLGCLESFPA